MDRSTRSVLLSVLVTSGMTLAAFGWAASPRSSGPPQPGEDLEITLSAQPGIEGEPHENVTGIWIARVTGVTRDEPYASYAVVLRVNGSDAIGPAVVRPGILGRSGPLALEFFDSGTYCYPVPCPPPDGPDGKLGVDDYFRISHATPGTQYVLRVLWAETGRAVGELVIET